MSEEFFERLTKRVYKRLDYLDGLAGVETEKYGAVDATIEALKGTMVDRPIEGRLFHHTTPHGEPWTSVWLSGTNERITISRHHGTDGEEVVVMVFSQGDFEEK